MEFKNPILFAILLAILIHPGILVTSEEVEDEREYSYMVGSENGPEHWGELREEWATCGNGNLQSPIDILDHRVDLFNDLGKLNQSYKPSNAVLINRGHDIMVKWADGAGSIYVEGTEYVLKQCHWHSPSEHTVNGRRFVLEGHMVHESADKKIAVVGIMYKIGDPDPFISKLMGPILAIADKEEAEKAIGMVDPSAVKMGGKKYYRYTGSLTTPPCTEGVIWTVLRKVSNVSSEQVNLLREAVKDNYETNARPIQPTNHRPVNMFCPLKSIPA